MKLLKLRDTDLHWREIHGEIIALEARGSVSDPGLSASGAITRGQRSLGSDGRVTTVISP
jgi:hypothetical protein